jgi:hypothetical protein
MVKDWLHIHDFDPSSWGGFDNVKLWWSSIVLAHGGTRKAMATLFMLVAWEIWNERTARIFKHGNTMPTIMFDRIKSEVGLGFLPVLNIWVFSLRESKLLWPWCGCKNKLKFCFTSFFFVNQLRTFCLFFKKKEA